DSPPRVQAGVEFTNSYNSILRLVVHLVVDQAVVLGMVLVEVDSISHAEIKMLGLHVVAPVWEVADGSPLSTLVTNDWLRSCDAFSVVIVGGGPRGGGGGRGAYGQRQSYHPSSLYHEPTDDDRPNLADTSDANSNSSREDRPRLKLKPRTAPIGEHDDRQLSERSKAIFGTGRPREASPVREIEESKPGGHPVQSKMSFLSADQPLTRTPSKAVNVPSPGRYPQHLAADRLAHSSCNLS
ncbi:uncharacterized protein DEA37_0013073, partial [Paragonimus westermani]